MWAVVTLAGELGSAPASSAYAVLARAEIMVGVWGRGRSRGLGGAVWDLLIAAPAPTNATVTMYDSPTMLRCLLDAYVENIK